MVWLALDASQQSGSIALGNTDNLIYSSYFSVNITHSETLMPQIDYALKFSGLSQHDLCGVVLTNGPGSFTGLRIGLATAKGIAYGLKIPLLTYSTLELLAVNMYHCGFDIAVLLDAKMKEVYAALYDSQLNELIAPHVTDITSFAEKLNDKVMIIGNATLSIAPILNSRHVIYYQAAVHANLCQAAGLFSLMNIKPQDTIYDFDIIANLEPQYLRESTAQIKKRLAASK